LEIFNQLANNPEDNYSELEQPYNIRFIDKAVSGYYMEHTFDYLFNHFSYASFHPREFYWKGYFIMHDDSTHEILKDKRTNSEFFSLRPQPQRSPSGKKYAIIGRSPKLFSYAVFLVNGSSGTEQVIDLAQIKTDQMLKKDLQAVSWLNDNTLCFYSSHGTFKYSIWNGEIQQMKDVEGYVLPSADGETLYWEDFDGSVWKRSVNESAKQLVTSNAFDITLWGDELYFRRNSSDGISEIYRLNVKTYKEEKVLSSKEHGFSSPQVSPDGQYLAVTGNATSPISKKENLDIFVCRTDGSQLRQLTDHPGSDQCPVWSADGTRIFFLSERRTDGTKWSEGNAGWLYRMDLKLNK
jgi:dipeptidyl aminopeptidase/acylaminoacyl peptidase